MAPAYLAARRLPSVELHASSAWTQHIVPGNPCKWNLCRHGAFHHSLRQLWLRRKFHPIRHDQPCRCTGAALPPNDYYLDKAGLIDHQHTIGRHAFTICGIRSSAVAHSINADVVKRTKESKAWTCNHFPFHCLRMEPLCIQCH